MMYGIRTGIAVISCERRWFDMKGPEFDNESSELLSCIIRAVCEELILRGELTEKEAGYVCGKSA